MVCPDDGSELLDDGKGLSSCGRCRGHGISGEAFSTIHEDITQLLRAEADRESGAYARRRPCPRCLRTMVPLRIGDQLAWLESCQACGMLWVEKLDEAVMRRLERRGAVTHAVESMTPEARSEMAHDVARELADHHRRLRVLEAIKGLLELFGAW